ncbi:MAG: squalene synthase HpnC [Candidatus Korobacteraceae bacterium]|jgi:squalene synthase HpnC
MSSAPTDNQVQFAASELTGWRALPPEYAIPERAPSLAEAQQYCSRLAHSHYENFSVVTWFLPKHLHQHFYNVYAYCRISDDLGDEVGDPQQALALLDEWEAELNATYLSLAPQRLKPGTMASSPSTPEGVPLQGSDRLVRVEASPRHPVFIALRETVREFDIPRAPFVDLLTAFRQDQTVTRYPTFEDVLGYCKNSANPVGHLVLYLCGYRDAERQRLSDYTCTALQLANFWQDVAVDYAKQRIYLPLESLAKFGVMESDIAERRATPQFCEMMKFEVRRARGWFQMGLPLAGKVNKHLAIDIELFSRGGLAILDAIERQDYDVLSRRPAISKARKLWLLARAAVAGIPGTRSASTGAGVGKAL